MDPLAYTKPQAAALIGISTRHLERVIKAGGLGVVKIGRCVRIPRAEIEAYIQARTVHQRREKCPTKEKGRRTTTPASRSAVERLDEALAPLIGAKRNRSSGNGKPKPSLTLIHSRKS